MALMQSNKAGPSKSPLSRSSHGRFEYDVFLSFRGEDTRNNFTGLLRDMLYLKCIRPFFDEDDLHKGERIEEILVAISRSKVFVPIFSKSYADSKWCMREVAKMVEYRQHGGQERLIIPVFFDVDPKHVRHQSGPFQDAFEKHLTDNSREVEGWKQALEYVGGISGFHLKNGYEIGYENLTRLFYSWRNLEQLCLSRRIRILPRKIRKILRMLLPPLIYALSKL